MSFHKCCRFDKWAPITLVAVAAIVRAAALWHFSGNVADDRDGYLTVAGQYLAHGFTRPFEVYPSSFRPPLYPLLLAGILEGGGGSATIGVVQLLLGALTVWLTSRIGAKLGLGGFAYLAALFVALDPVLIEYTTFPMTETLFTLLLAGWVAAALPAFVPTGADALPAFRVPHAMRAVAIGALFGLCALCRPTVWPALAAGGAWLAWRQRGSRGIGRWIVLAAASTCVGAGCVLMGWVMRNFFILGTPVITTTHGGYTLLLGNNADFYRDVAARPFLQIWSDPEPDRFQASWYRRVVAEMNRDLGSGADEVEQDRWMYRRAWKSIAAQPSLFLRACMLRFARFWNVAPLAPSRTAIPAGVVWGVGAGYVIELGLFVLGLASLGWRRDGRWAALLIVIATFTLVHLVYWSDMRMRAPLVPLIGLIAARGLAECVARRKVNKHVAVLGAPGNA